MSMKQLVMYVALAATGVAAIAVVGMIAIALVHDHDATATVLNNLQMIALLIVTAVAGIIQHYMAAGQSAPSQSNGQPGTSTGASSVPASGGQNNQASDVGGA